MDVSADNLELNIEFQEPSIETVLNTYDEYSDINDPDFFYKQGSEYNSDSTLYDLLLTESFNKNGLPLVYYVSTYDTNYDKIFGEDNDRRFERKFNCMCYTPDLPKEEQIWTQFGIEGLDNFQLFISQRHFKVVSDDYVPKVGDVIYTKYNNRYYEINDVGQEDNMFLQRKHTWTLTVAPFKDNNVSLNPATSATMQDDIGEITNQDDDLFNISDYVDNEKDDILYDPSDTEETPDDIWGSW
ncbi:MAG: hypothetical protein ACOC2U_02780 [bacterium]